MGSQCCLAIICCELVERFLAAFVCLICVYALARVPLCDAHEALSAA